MPKTIRASRIVRKLAQDEIMILDVSGRYAYVSEADGPLALGFDSETPSRIDIGTGYFGAEGADGERFSKITIQNLHDDENEIVIVAGEGDFRDNRFTLVPSRDFALPVMESPSIIKAIGSGTIAAGTEVLVTGIYSDPGLIRRKHLIVSNEDTSLKAQIIDGNNEVCAVVFPETSICLSVSGIIKVKNPNGAAIQVRVSEIIHFNASA